MRIEHFVRLTCHCGNTVDVPGEASQSTERRHDDRGSVYQLTNWQMPDGWSYADCPACRVPVSAYDEETINGGEP